MTKYFIAAIAITALLLGATIALPDSAYAQCTPDPGTAGDDNITCTGNDPDGVDAQGGNDTITVVAGGTVTTVGIIPGTGDDSVNVQAGGNVSTVGNAIDDADGNDTFNIAGNVSSFGGIAVRDNLGNDSYNISGNVTNDAGIAVFDVDGNDTYTISGNVSNNIGISVQDNAGNDSYNISGRVINTSGIGVFDTSGNDTYVISGSVENTNNDGIFDVAGNDSFNISGSVTTTVGTGVNVGAGEDTVRLTGTTIVGGNGTAIDAGDDNDQVIIESDASLTGVIEGGSGNDTLTFAQDVPAEEFAEIVAIINANPNNGTITINNQRYTWQNFEQLVNLIGQIAPELLQFIAPVTEQTCAQGGATVFRNPATGWEVYYNGDHVATFSFEQAASPPVTLTNATTGFSARLETDNSISILDANGNFLNGSCGYLN